MALNYGFIWGQPEAFVASTLFGGVRHAAAHLLLLLLIGQAMLTIPLYTHSSLPKWCLTKMKVRNSVLLFLFSNRPTLRHCAD